MPEIDYGPDYRDKLLYKHSWPGRIARWRSRLNRHRVKWYLIRGLAVGVLAGVVVTLLLWALLWG